MKDTTERLWRLADVMIKTLQEMGDAVEAIKKHDRLKREVPDLPECWGNLSYKKRLQGAQETIKCHKDIKEALVSLLTLYDLRQAYWEDAEGWEPDWEDDEEDKWCIVLEENEIVVSTRWITSQFLAFPTKEQAKHFFKYHYELIEQAKPLI